MKLMVDPSSSVINNLHMCGRWWCWWPIKIFQLFIQKSIAENALELESLKCEQCRRFLSILNQQNVSIGIFMTVGWNLIRFLHCLSINSHEFIANYFQIHLVNSIAFHSCHIHVVLCEKEGFLHFLAISNSCISHTWRIPFSSLNDSISTMN